MSSGKIRVRFAPSPTGLLHVGNARTALYNWLFARRFGGDLILRIEDTDVGRSEERYEVQIMKDLHWLGLDWDEGPDSTDAGETGECGPYRQSERLAIYAEHTERLLAEGKAYRCFCTQEELEKERDRAISERRPQVYSGRCRKLTAQAASNKLTAGIPYSVRLKLDDRPIRFHDIVRGSVEFASSSISDPILVRSARGGAIGTSIGIPVYNYVVAVDDALMGITHVIRGDDHISNTPKQVAIYNAFGWKAPHFVHLSTILGADHERLSKRHGATSIATFREMGYLPEALINYLALLGWGAEDDKSETFTLEELVNAFRLERVTASPTVFDFEKLDWINRHYLKLASPARLASLAWEYFGGLVPTKEIASDEVLVWFVKLVALFAPTVNHLNLLPAKSAFIFGFDPDAARAHEDNVAVLGTDSARTVLGELAARVRAHSGELNDGLFKEWMEEIKTATGVGGRELFHPVRIAITGSSSGPEFDKVIPLIEEGAALGIGILNVRQRVERFMGV